MIYKVWKYAPYEGWWYEQFETLEEARQYAKDSGEETIITMDVEDQDNSK